MQENLLTQKGTNIEENGHIGCLVFNVKDLQTVLGIGRETAYILMRNRAFPSVRIGNRYVVEKDALKAWLKRYEGKEFKF